MLSIPSPLLAILDNGGPTSRTASHNPSQRTKRMPGQSCTWLRSSSNNKLVAAAQRKSPSEYAGWLFDLGLYRGNSCHLRLGVFPFSFLFFFFLHTVPKEKAICMFLLCFFSLFSGFVWGVAIYRRVYDLIFRADKRLRFRANGVTGAFPTIQSTLFFMYRYL